MKSRIIMQVVTALCAGMALWQEDSVAAQPLPAFTISQRTTQPLMTSEMPWESAYLSFFNVIRDTNGWHMWYTAYATGYTNDNAGRLCYASSTDGVVWTRPQLGLVEYAGSTTNNILIDGPTSGGMHGTTVFIDTNAPASERYKLVFSRGEMINGTMTWIVHGAVSADGLVWEMLPAPVLNKNSDTQSVCFRDGDLYRLYVRMWSGSIYTSKRIVGYSESLTFTNFPDPVVILAPTTPPDPADLHFYNSAATKLKDDLYVMFPSAYFTGDQTVRPYLAASTNGFNFERVGTNEFLALGAPGTFDSKSIYVAPGAVAGDTPGTWWIYYLAYAHGHDGTPVKAGGYGRFLLEINIVSNTSPTNVTQTAAWLNGELLTEPETVGIRWGPAAGATNGIWAHEALLGVQTAGPLSFQATNLNADTRYAYTFYVTNGQEVFTAEPVAFFSTSFAAGNAPSGLSAVNTNAIVTLQWMDNSASETGFRLERSTNGVDWVLDQVTATDVTNAMSAGLSQGVWYDYRVQAFSETDATPFSNTSRVQTASWTYRVSTFLTNGIFEYAGGEVEYLVVGGGGGGGPVGGGGGGGGFRTGTVSVAGGSYAITVGAGGAAGTQTPLVSGGNGGTSTFHTIMAAGGGGGAKYDSVGLAGGSGGGAAWHSVYEDWTNLGGAGNTPATDPAQGWKGGNSVKVAATDNYYFGGGGGGAGQEGGVGRQANLGNNVGGGGRVSSISGTAVTYAGGGGGGTGYRRGGPSYKAAGGAGGGGTGGGSTLADKDATSGTAGLGGGGGGSGNDATSWGLPGRGGSGVVILRYAVTDSDLDNDGIPNEWEALYYGGTTNANPDALAANGVNTVREAYIADLNPTNPASYFRITAVSNLPPCTVYFEASAGRAYTLIGVSNLVDGVWTNVPGAGPRLGTGGADVLRDTNVPPKGPFYQLKVELP